MNNAETVAVAPIPAREVLPWLLQRHYARRRCPISYAFAAYRRSEVIGIVTFGTPASAPLRDGIAGKEWSKNILELNRLCCVSEANLASTLVGRALRLLPRPSIIVSYADQAHGHVGYVYQATNFIYTGLSAKRTDWKIKGREHLHGATVADLSRGRADRAQWMRETYGPDFYLNPRSRKHRYVFFVGTRAQQQKMRSALRYSQEPFPKGESHRYAAEQSISTQTVLTLQ